jgi:cytochrome c-type biogenesis protein CcmH/NrfF
VPAGAATTAGLLLALVLVPAYARAQTAENVRPEQRSDLQRQLEAEIMCTCGCRLAVGTCGMMNCHGRESQRKKLAAHLAAGKDHDQVIEGFIAEFGGQDILMAPVDRGFNRLAWLLPYLVGVGGLLAIAAMARRWARPATATPAGTPDLDADLRHRLDDELRNLD